MNDVDCVTLIGCMGLLMGLYVIICYKCDC